MAKVVKIGRERETRGEGREQIEFTGSGSCVVGEEVDHVILLLVQQLMTGVTWNGIMELVWDAL
ncbi:MAG: hypothetical protein CMJ95_11330 [Planctomycetes bacterium]|nr:hypothetical protein [Planctomycetota bacterium]